MNKVILIGRLGQDAEIKQLSGGNVVRFSLATSEKYKNKEGVLVESTQWHNISLFNSDQLAPYLTKGTQVSVDGKIVYSEKDGKYFTGITAQRIELLGSKPNNDQPKESKPLENVHVVEPASTDLPF